MDREESGQFTTQYTNEEILSVFDSAPIPVLTAPEVAAEVGCSRNTARNRLEELVADAHLHRKEVGARAVVYVRPTGNHWRYWRWKRSP